MDMRGFAGRRRGRPPSSSHSPALSRRRGLHALPPRPPPAGAASDGGRLRRGRPPGRGRSRGRARSILPPNSDLMPMPTASLPLFSAVSPTAPATVAASSSTTRSDGLPLMTDLTQAEIERRRQIWLGKRPAIDSSSGTAAF